MNTTAKGVVQSVRQRLLNHSRKTVEDFYDAWVLLQRFQLDEAVLTSAIRATFKRRGTATPTAIPLAFTEEFAEDPAKRRQWTGFLRRSGLPSTHELVVVVHSLRDRLMPLLIGAET